MSTYFIEKVENEPVVVVTITSDYSIGRDMTQSDADSKAFLEALNEPMYWVMDIRQAKFTLNMVIEGSNQGARGAEPFWHHPLIIQMLVISNDRLIKFAAKGMNTVTFGNLDIRVFDTIEEMLAYCRSQQPEIR